MNETRVRFRLKAWKQRKLLLVPAFFLLASTLSGAVETNQLSPEFVRQILQRLDQDERELRDLRQQLSARPAAQNAPTNTLPSAAAPLEERLKTQDEKIAGLERELTENVTGASKTVYPNLQFHCFGDLDYAADSRRAVNVPGNVGGIPYGVGYYGIKNTFYLGELVPFLTAQLGENTSVLSETALSAGSDNHMGIDIERLYLEQRFNDYFNVDVGRFHTSLGYYNATYHHGLWLQTAIGRPTFLQFEDSGGILPVHMVGIDIHGAIPSGSLNLSYHVELGNGMDYAANPNLNAVQQLISFSDTKAVDVALTAKPEWLPGVEFGANAYFDSIHPDNSGSTNTVPRNDQMIYGAYAVFHNARWEFLNEGYVICDKPAGGPTHYDPCFYTQLGCKFGVITPYVRFTYYDISLADTLYTEDWAGGFNAGAHYGPGVGLRYDFTTYAALKAQYDYLVDHGYNDASRITLQACFTF
jgi:hypothetical protein